MMARLAFWFWFCFLDVLEIGTGTVDWRWEMGKREGNLDILDTTRLDGWIGSMEVDIKGGARIVAR
jgi:hypothetical protein